MTDGLITVPSRLGPVETMERLDAAIKARGLTVFARIDHAAGATEAGLSLRPTDLIIFGHAKGGTPLMQDRQVIGLDLPLKILVWQDEAGRTLLSYADPAWLAQHYGLDAAVEPTVKALTALLKALVVAAPERQA